MLEGPRTILHVDMDAFFASVEVLLDPSLAGKPVIVGGAASRGVVASCSYEARAFGVRSAMPSVRAMRLCPNAVFLPGHRDLYVETSRRLHAIFESVTHLVEGVSLDEAFLDVSGSQRLFGPGREIAFRVRERVSRELGLGASVGVAPSKLLAKLASRAAKPSPLDARPGRGVVVVEPGEELAFLHPLPVKALWGVGPAMYRRLERFGVRTVGDLAALPLDSLVTALGGTLGRHLHDLAWARDESPVEPHRVPRSLGHEQTYPRDLHVSSDLHAEAVRMADLVAGRLRGAGLAGRTVTIKVRYGDFTTFTRSRTLTKPADTGPAIAEVACALAARVDPSCGVRLFGVSVSNLVAGRSRQLTLEDGSPAAEKVAAAVDAVRQRFGADALAPAVALGAGRVSSRGGGLRPAP